jgi:glutamate-1-semialdehyde aminotransferase
VAALATIHKHRRLEVAKRLVAVGQCIQEGWREAANKAGLAIDIGGIPPLSHFNLIGNDAQATHTLFTQLMLERGFLAGRAFYSTYAHQDEHIESYLNAVDEIFGIIVESLYRGNIRALLKGPVAHTGFHRLT